MDFLTRQKKLQAEAKMALAMAKPMAKMQVEVEKQNRKKSPVADLVSSAGWHAKRAFGAKDGFFPSYANLGFSEAVCQKHWQLRKNTVCFFFLPTVTPKKHTGQHFTEGNSALGPDRPCSRVNTTAHSC